MTTPERYTNTCGSGLCMDRAPDGEWVSHDDYLALRAEVERLRRHGTLLSNIAYNLAKDDRLPDAVRWSLDDARKKWDAALAREGGE